jgi:hypothetical protein
MGSKKLNVGVILGSNLEAGGGFQYESRIVDIISNYKSTNYNFKFFSFNKHIINDYKIKKVETHYIYENRLSKIYRHLLRIPAIFKISNRLKLGYSKIEETLLKKHKTDLVYFLSPSTYAIDFINIPYIITIWDLCHRDHNEFPEVRNNKSFENKEYFYNIVLKKAISITADSELGKKNIIRRYGIDDSRIQILKFLPRIDRNYKKNSINIKQKYNLKDHFIFYPAQFWAHKNHIYILKALRHLKENHSLVIDAAFSGANKGNLNYILDKAMEYGIEKQIHYIGFVPDEDIPFLYKEALAMTMPTYFGPTNIPPLEAFSYKCPVCYSDLNGFSEQVEDAAFMMDLNRPENLADHIITILNNKKLVESKIEKGSKILNSWTEEDCLAKIIMLLDKYSSIRERWQ